MKKVLACIAVLLVALAGSCSSGGDGEENLVVNLTDAPMDGVRAVNVTITGVRIHESADVDPGAAGWRDLPVRAPMPVDLMQLRGGVLFELCRTRLDAGHYQQVRLVVAPNAGANPPYNNSVRTMDGQMHPLDIPSDIKIVHSFRVADGTRTDLTIDFDAGMSMHQRGTGDYFMQPVINASSTMR